MKKKKILVLGSTGMAGHIVYYYLNELNTYDIINVSYRNRLTEETILIDIKDKQSFESFLLNSKPDIVINCVGVLIKGSKDEENAIYINAYFPHHLEKLCITIDARLIHISTDCVFSGGKGNYNETDLKDANDIYGLSKSLGEINNTRHLTIRTSLVGPELKSNGEGLFHWFMTQKGEITGFTNAIWSGVSTLELAKAIGAILKDDSVSGILHLTNGIPISKFDLLGLFARIWKINYITIKKGVSHKMVDKSLSKSLKMPFNVQPYEGMFKDLYEWTVNHKELYSQYYIEDEVLSRS